MRILSCCWGSTGDISPQIHLGGELTRRGYDVHVIANPYFESLVASSNARFTPVGTREDHERLLTDSDLFDSGAKSVQQVEEIFARHYYPFLEPLCTALESLHLPGRTCLLVGELIAAISFAERWDIPVFSVYVSPDIAQRSRFDPRCILPGIANGPTLPANHPVTLVRKQVGLSADAIAYDPVKILCLWSDWFAPTQPDWPSNAITTGFVLPPSAKPVGGPTAGGSEPGQLPGPIVFTTGSVASGQAEFFAAATDVCRRLGVPGCLVTPNRDQVPLHLPDNIEYVSHAPFETLFSNAAMVVHHGGIGTGALALAAGIPQVLCPIAGDQFYNANRFERLGVGKVFDARESSYEGLMAAVQATLVSPTIARQCTHWRARMAEENGAQRAADCVEHELG